GAAVGDHAGGEQQLARAVGLAAVVVEEHARRAMQLGDDDALGAVDDEGAVVGHERDLAHVDLLLLHVLDRLGARLAVVDHQAHGDAQRGAVAQAAVAALALVEHRLAELVADVFQRGVAAVAADREHRLQRGVQALVLALGGVDVLLQELAVGVDLDGEQERHLEDRTALAEVLADALLLGERILRGGLGHGACASSSRTAAQTRPRGKMSCQTTGTVSWKPRVLPAPARLLMLLPTTNSVGFGSVPLQRPKAGGAGPPAFSVSSMQADDASTAYFTSTVAPAASRSFFILSASSFDTPSFTVPPASVRSLASFRPRPVMARTALITSTFLSPADFRMTLNSVCSSAAAPAAAGPAATATGAAAETPNFSSMAFTSSITSISDLAAMASTICSLDRDISITSGKCSIEWGTVSWA